MKLFDIELEFLSDAALISFWDCKDDYCKWALHFGLKKECWEFCFGGIVYDCDICYGLGPLFCYLREVKD
jgi:hypothetical protein